MSWRSFKFSLLAILLTSALLVGDAFLFGVETILGIVGIVAILVVPGFLLRKAVIKANGLLDKIIAMVVAPLLIIAVGFFTIMGIVVWH